MFCNFPRLSRPISVLWPQVMFGITHHSDRRMFSSAYKSIIYLSRARCPKNVSMLKYSCVACCITSRNKSLHNDSLTCLIPSGRKSTTKHHSGSIFSFQWCVKLFNYSITHWSWHFSVNWLYCNLSIKNIEVFKLLHVLYHCKFNVFGFFLLLIRQEDLEA